MAVHCPSCGGDLPDTAKACGYCGARLPDQDSRPSQDAARQVDRSPPPTTPEPATGRGRRRLVRASLAAGAVVVTLLVAFVVVDRNSSDLADLSLTRELGPTSDTDHPRRLVYEHIAADGRSSLVAIDDSAVELSRAEIPCTDWSVIWDVAADGGWVLYECGEDDIVRTMRVDGSSPAPFAADDTSINSPAWTPDMTRMMFNSDIDGTGAYLMDIDGTNVVKVTDEFGFNPVWSDDGSHLAFLTESSDDDGQSYDRVGVIGTDGSDLWFEDFPALQAVAWRPGHDLLIVCTDRQLVELDVTNRSMSTLATLDEPKRPTAAAWSPSGAQIAVTLWDDTAFLKRDIVVLDAAGNTVGWPAAELADEVGPVWSPEGDRIAFSREITEDDYAIFTADVDGGGLRLLVDAPGLDFALVWLP